jgi:hypothetical protein
MKRPLQISNILSGAGPMLANLRAFGRRWSKILVIIVCSLLMFLLAILNTPTNIHESGPFGTMTDNSWVFGLASKLQQGEISGRDFYFTYGFLSQVLIQFGSMLNKSGSPVDGFPFIVLSFWTLNIVLLAILLILIEQIDAKCTLFIITTVALLNSVYFNFAVFRTLILLLYATLLYRAMSASDDRTQIILAVIVGIVCLIAQLFITDLGLFAIFSTVLILGGYAIFARFPVILKREDLHRPVKYLQILGIVLSIFIFGNLFISIFFKLSSENYDHIFDYQRYGFEIIRGYNYTMGIEWMLPWLPTIILCIIVVYVICFILINLRRIKTSDGYLLFSLMIASLTQLKSATIRSDQGHIVFALIPIVFLFLLIGRDWEQKGRIRLEWSILLVALFAIWPSADLSVIRQLGILFEGQIPLVSKLRQIHSLPLPPDKFFPTDLMDEFNDQTRPMLNFPYENYIAIKLGRRMVAPVLQTYSAHTEALQQKYVELLKRQPDTMEVLYGLDKVVSDDIDRVQHVSRVPIIFEYLYRNFELKSQKAYGGGYYLLQRRPKPLDIKGVDLSFTVDKTSDSNMVFRLNQPTPCSMVRLRIKIGYPITSLLGRPNALHLSFLLNGEELHRSDLVPIETGREFSTYVSLIDANEFFHVFGSSGTHAKNWDRLEISPRATGLFGVSPNLVEISKLECVNFPNPPLTSEDALFDVTNTSLWQTYRMELMKTETGTTDTWIVGPDPQLEYKERLNLCLGDYTHFYVRMAASPDIKARGIQIYYKLDNEPAFNGVNLLLIPLSTDGEMHEYTYDVRFLGNNLQSRLTGIRFDPVYDGSSVGESKVRILDFRLIRGEKPSVCTMQASAGNPFSDDQHSRGTHALG